MAEKEEVEIDISALKESLELRIAGMLINLVT